MHKIVNLDDQRNKLTITVSGKTFEITRIVHSIIQEYGEYMKISGEYINKVREMSKVVDSKESTAEQIKQAAEQLQEEIAEYSGQKVDMIYKITETILVKNGYEFKKQWWLDNSTISEMETFCVTCIQKDMPEDKKKEKAIM